MNCPKCSNNSVTVAVASNGFGTWQCHACNASGSYPPSEEDNCSIPYPINIGGKLTWWTFSSVLASVLLVLSVQADDTSDARARAAIAIAQAQANAAGPTAAPPTLSPARASEADGGKPAARPADPRLVPTGEPYQWARFADVPDQLKLFHHGVQVGAYQYSTGIYRHYDAETNTWSEPGHPPVYIPATVRVPAVERTTGATTRPFARRQPEGAGTAGTRGTPAQVVGMTTAPRRTGYSTTFPVGTFTAVQNAGPGGGTNCLVIGGG